MNSDSRSLASPLWCPALHFWRARKKKNKIKLSCGTIGTVNALLEEETRTMPRWVEPCSRGSGPSVRRCVVGLQPLNRY